MSVNPFDWKNPRLPTFVGRESELRDIARGTVLNAHSYGLMAGRGMGKTAFLKALTRELRGPADWAAGLRPIPINLSLRAAPEKSPGGLFEDILLKLAAQLPGRTVPKAVPTIDIFAASLAEWLYAAPEVQVVVLFDDLRPLLQTSWWMTFLANWRGLLMEDHWGIAARLASVFVGGAELGMLRYDQGSPLNLHEWRSLRNLAKSEIAALTARAPTLAEHVDEVAHEVYALSGGHPTLSQYILFNVVTRWSKSSIQTLAEEAAAAYLKTCAPSDFAGWWKGFGEDAGRLYGAVAQSADGLATPHMFLGRFDATARAIELLQQSGVIDDDGERLFPSCRLFRRWWAEQEPFKSTQPANAPLSDEKVPRWVVSGEPSHGVPAGAPPVRALLLLISHNLGGGSDEFVEIQVIRTEGSSLSQLASTAVWSRWHDRSQDLRTLRAKTEALGASVDSGGPITPDRLRRVMDALKTLVGEKFLKKLAEMATPGTRFEIAGALPELPWELLPVGSPPAPLCLRAQVYRSPGPDALPVGQGRNTLLLLEGNDHPSYKAEADALARFWSSAVGADRVLRATTAAAAMEIVSTRPLTAVHFAGHQGPATDGTPGLSLRGGVLPIRLLCDQLMRAPPKLVFLNGCTTAGVSQEAPNQSFSFGALDVLLGARLPAVVATLWNIRPPDTSLVTTLYSTWLRSGSVGQAVTAARLEVSPRDEWSATWPAYVVLSRSP